MIRDEETEIEKLNLLLRVGAELKFKPWSIQLRSRAMWASMWPSQYGCVLHKALLMKIKKKMRHCASERELWILWFVFLSLTRPSNQRGSITEGKFARPTQWGQANQNVRVWSRERWIVGPSKENRWLMLKRLKLSSRFQGRFYKENLGGGLQSV